MLAPAPTASAANELKPRVPVVWAEGPCTTIVDQSTAAIVHFDYSVSVEEDPEDRTFDEVDDSRTHQFFAFRKQDLPANDPPVWISRADIERARTRDPNVDPQAITPDMVLEDATRFAPDEWVRITPDDGRVPITFAQAAIGVDWDTSEVEPGTYEIWAYTWEPQGNIWSRRQGIVKLVASASAAADAGPSISLLEDQTQIVARSPYTPPGCADVAPGTTVTLEWGEKVGTIVPQWNLAFEHQPIESGPLAFVFEPPEAAADTTTIVLRATVTDDTCRSYAAYSSVLDVLANSQSGEDVEVPRGKDPCSDGGGGCSIDQRSYAGLVLLPLLAWRRRRRPRP